MEKNYNIEYTFLYAVDNCRPQNRSSIVKNYYYLSSKNSESYSKNKINSIFNEFLLHFSNFLIKYQESIKNQSAQTKFSKFFQSFRKNKKSSKEEETTNKLRRFYCDMILIKSKYYPINKIIITATATLKIIIINEITIFFHLNYLIKKQY